VQDNHIKPAVVLWLTFADISTAADAEKESVLRDLTEAGLPVITPAGFAEQHTPFTAPGSRDACSLAVANSPLAFTVSSTDKFDTLAAGA
jgi:hypothetical protein